MTNMLKKSKSYGGHHLFTPLWFRSGCILLPVLQERAHSCTGLLLSCKIWSVKKKAQTAGGAWQTCSRRRRWWWTYTKRNHIREKHWEAGGVVGDLRAVTPFRKTSSTVTPTFVVVSTCRRHGILLFLFKWNIMWTCWCLESFQLNAFQQSSLTKQSSC